MGKFQGKSCRTGHRKRLVRLSKRDIYPEDDCIRANKNMCIGLAVFREVFGSSDKGAEDFRGFTIRDIRTAIQAARQEHSAVKSRLELSGSSVVLNHDAFDIVVQEFNLQTRNTPYCESPTSRNRRRAPWNGKQSIPSRTKDQDCITALSNAQQIPDDGVTSIQKSAAKKLLEKAKKSSQIAAVTPRVTGSAVPEKGINNATRKFVLPTRSAHSSRVIKPSKRVIESEAVLSDTTPSPPQIQLKKPKLILASSSKQPEQVFSSIGTASITGSNKDSLYPFKAPGELTNNFSNYSEGINNLITDTSTEDTLIVEGKRRWKPTYKVQLKLRELNVFGAGTSRFSSKPAIGSRSSSSQSNQTSSAKSSSSRSSEKSAPNESEDSSSNSQWPSPRGKAILRKPRLKLDNSTTFSPNEGSFSAGFANTVHHVKTQKGNVAMPGTVECGVCGAVRFYKFIKQARKFGIFCCESCRKFIAKMVLRLKVKGPLLECHLGEGMCKNVPIVRSQQWKAASQIRCLYKARCPACWLKMCLRYFHMPSTLRRSLSRLLPVDMRADIDGMPDDDDEGDETKIREDGSARVGASVDGDISSEAKLGLEPNSSEISSKRKRKMTSKYVIEREQSAVLPKEIPLNQKILKKASKKLVKSSIKRAAKKSLKKSKEKSRKKASGSDGSRRQRADMKGPRVKHVCRSASIVLGQPLAIFPQAKAAVAETVAAPRKAVKGSHCTGCDRGAKDHVCTRKEGVGQEGAGKKTVVADAGKGAVGDGPADEVPLNAVAQKKNKLSPPPMVRQTLQALTTDRAAEQQRLVSIDFWESYDPEEVCNTGFGLIGSEAFHTRAMCFLCGSAGLEKLIHCVSCCEPYHRFCLYDGLRDQSMSLHNSKDEWRLDWVCQRCKVCHTCGRGSGKQLSCQRCSRAYHTSCLGGDRINRLQSADRPWVCSLCLRCNSCASPVVTQFVGNLPFCNPCFRLRKKGNYCPLCQKCYEDDDYDSKMMECGQCKCWVHAKCEGLSDEKYQVLSFLPESVEFVCRMCYPEAPWRGSVDEALKVGFTAVIKSLSKNRKARSLLKYSPKKKCFCRAPPTLGKTLPFPELDESGPVREDVVLEDALEPVEPVELSVTLKEPALQLLGEPVVQLLKEPVAQLLKEPVAQVLKEPVAQLLKEPVAQVLKEPVAQLLKEPMTRLLKEPVAQVLKEPVAQLLKEPMTQLLKEPVAQVLKEPAAQLLKEPVVRLVKVEPVKAEPVKAEASKTEPTKVDPVDILDIASLKEKYKIHDCSVRVQKYDLVSTTTTPTVGADNEDSAFSDSSCGKTPPVTLSTSAVTPSGDSGVSVTDDEQKASSADESTVEVKRVYAPSSADMAYGRDAAAAAGAASDENASDENTVECRCVESFRSTQPTLLSIKRKVDNDEFSSVVLYNREMEDLLKLAGDESEELVATYRRGLKELFPWFDPDHDQVSVCLRPERSDEELSGSALSIQESLPVESVQDSGAGLIPEAALGKSLDYYYSGNVVADLRACVLCRGAGDGPPAQEARLLYCGQNEWTHANCALWSSEVFEEIDGSLQNVHSAVFRGRKMTCVACGRKGASLGCCARNCFVTYHFPCARRAGCRFTEDKNVYCPTHRDQPEAGGGKSIDADNEFDLRRPIYVELDRKKKRYVEPKQVRFAIGSLCVEDVGVYASSACDTGSAIIPAEFRCTRLYWSTEEPWRIVQYTVTTTVPKFTSEEGRCHGMNVTIDHGQDREVVGRQLRQVSEWHRQLLPSEADSDDKSDVNEVVVKEVMDEILDTVARREAEENAADLLPQEWEDAIFENLQNDLPQDLPQDLPLDLPHELLEGFDFSDPKLLNYEDFSSMDLKDPCYSPDGDGLNDGKDALNEEAVMIAEAEEIAAGAGGCESEAEDRPGDETEASRDQKCDTTSDTVTVPPPKARPTAAPGTTRSQQRSCSLTWSCTLDTSKRRKITTRGTRSGGGDTNLISIDVGAAEHTLHELRLPEGVLATLARSAAAAAAAAPGSEAAGLKDVPASPHRHRALHPEEEGKENKCLLWHGRPRLLQVDGGVDSCSSSEGGSPSPPPPEEADNEKKCLLWPRLLQVDGGADSCSSSSSSSSKEGSPPLPSPPSPQEGKEKKSVWLLQVDGGADSCSSSSEGGSPPPPPPQDLDPNELVKCSRCHRTYRTRSSFERHLPTCSSEFILSTSESDSETRSSEEDSSKKLPKDAEDDKDGIRRVECLPGGQPDIEVNEVVIKTEPVEQDVGPDPIITVHNLVETIVRPSEISNICIQNVVPPSPVLHQVQLPPQQQCPGVFLPSHGQPRPKPVTPARMPGSGRPRGRPPKPRAPPAAPDFRPQDMHPSVMAMMNHPMLGQSQQSVPVIVQQVPSANMVPSFLESFQQQSGANLQYIATIDVHSNAFNKPQQYLANGIVPGTYQLPDGYVGLQNGNVVQMGTQQPTVLGLIPQGGACGMMGTEQMVLNSGPLEMYQDQAGGVFLSSPQVYYGLETIVSNTVVSSQYMPGLVAASSTSYSATTTQVYHHHQQQQHHHHQSNKMESLGMDVPAGYVILPSQPQMTNQGMAPAPVRLPVVGPPQPPPRSQAPPTADWSYEYAPKNKDVVEAKRAADLHRPPVRPPMQQKQRPCYMPKTSELKTYGRRSPVRFDSAKLNLTRTYVPTGHVSSFKYAKASNNVSPVVSCSGNKNAGMPTSRPTMPALRPTMPALRPSVPAPRPTVSTPRPPAAMVPFVMKAQLKPVLKGNADLKLWQKSEEFQKRGAVVDAENVPVTVPASANGKSASQSPLKLVLQKSEKNGFYKITSHQTLPQIGANSVKSVTPQGNGVVTVKLCPTPVAVLPSGDKSPLAAKTESNKPGVPQKKRWMPKEKGKPLQPSTEPSNLLYQVHSQDGFTCTSTSVAEVWEKVFEAVQKARIHHKMTPLTRNPFGVSIGGLQTLGLSHNGLRYLVEQLPGVNRCLNYKPRYHKLTRPVDDDDTETVPVANPSGCARAEPFYSRSPYDLFSWLASRHRKPPKLVTPTDESTATVNRRATSSNLPMAMRFRHLKETSKEAVGVYRSHIHGRGLFCLRDIEAGEMVVEYAGEVIRSPLTDYREQLYDRKDIGCYMFRIDDQLVVDATMRGNAARFINHSCEPNCYSKVVDILGKKHILIFALRRIPQGEELTYDYKFPFEDVKIPCTCGSRRCRKHLN